MKDITYYDGPDSDYLYQKNLKIQPADWIYRNKKISYIWNSNGYRCPEWDNIKWESSHIIMGCSQIRGTGLAYEDTVGENLSRMINEPVINLGVGGTGWHVVAYNTDCLITAGILPKTVIIYVPHWERQAYWASGNDKPIFLIPNFDGVYSKDIRDMFYNWIKDPANIKVHSRILIEGIRARWENAGVKCLIFRPNFIEYDLDNLFSLSPDIDIARDVIRCGGHAGGHAGIETARMWANEIFQKFEKNRSLSSIIRSKNNASKKM